MTAAGPPAFPTHSGTYVSRSTPVSNISQNIPTTAGASYQIVFYAAATGIADILIASASDVTSSAILVSLTLTSSLGGTLPIGRYGMFVVTFVAVGPITSISFLTTEADSYIYIDDVSVTHLVVCYSGKSHIRCRNKHSGEISDVDACNIVSSVHEVYDNSTKTFVPIIYNIVNGPTNKYILIEKDSIAPNQPSEDFFVTPGHMIQIDGKEIKARDVPNAKTYKLNTEEMVYSICTRKRISMLVNGLNVMSWSVNKWLDYASQKNFVWKDNVVKKNSVCQENAIA